MISFQPTKEEAAFIEVAKEFAKNDIRPKARECEEIQQVDHNIVEKMRELGFLQLEFTEDWEGLELPLISQVQIWQALSYGDLGIVQGVPYTGDAASFLRQLPVHPKLEKEKSRIMYDKKAIALLDITEKSETFGEDISITAKEDGYVLHGISRPIRLARWADYLLIFAKDEQKKHLVLWLDQPDEWQVQEGDYRLGLLASGIGKVVFDDLLVSKDFVLHQGEKAREVIRQVQTRNYILQAAKETGLMQAALDYATEYTAGRKAFGQEIAKFQGVSFRIAKMAIETRIASLLVLEAAWHADQYGDRALPKAIRALNRSHRSLRYVTDSAVQLLGGHGFVQEFPVEKWMRDAQAQVILYGRERELSSKYGQYLITDIKERIL